MKWDEIICDLGFALQELVRFQTLANAGRFREIDRSDALYMVTLPDKRGDLIIGQSGAAALTRVAQRALASDPYLLRRASQRAIRAELERRFMRKLVAGEEIDQTFARDLINQTLVSFRGEKLATITHVLPCILSYDTGIPEFQLGPVRFITVERFLQENDEKLKKHTALVERRYRAQERLRRRRKESKPCLPSIRPPSIEESAQLFEREARSYLGTYKWVALIEVAGFDEETSEQVARISVEAGLNLLRLFLGDYHSHEFRLGGGFRIEENRARITEDSRGRLLITLSRGSGHAVIDSDWVDILFGSRGDPLLRMAGQLIFTYQTADKPPLIYRRLLDALAWYGEGVSEPLAHAKLIRYCNALETFLGTGRDEISTQIAMRAAYFCADDVFGDCLKWFNEVKKTYDRRSRLVHGDVSPFDGRISETVPLASTIARSVLLRGLEWTLWLAHQNLNMTSKTLHQHFEADLPKFAYGLLN